MLEKLKEIKNEKELNEIGLEIIYPEKLIGTKVNELIDKSECSLTRIMRYIDSNSSYVSTFRKFTENPDNITIKEAIYLSKYFKIDITELFYIKEDIGYNIVRDGRNKIYLDLENFEFITGKEIKRSGSKKNYYDKKEKKTLTKKEYDNRYKEEVVEKYNELLKEKKLQTSFVLREKIASSFYERYSKRFVEVGEKIKDRFY